jgi:hypothetical protein
MASSDEAFRMMRATLLGTLHRYDADRTGIVPAPNFVASIKGLGLNFGDPVVDSLMCQCRIDEDGFVNYSELRDAVEVRSRNDIKRVVARMDGTRPTLTTLRGSRFVRPGAHDRA